MLNWPGKRGSASRSAVKRARGVLAALPQGNAVAAVKAITEALESIGNAEGMRLEDRYDDIQQLDIAAQEHTQELLREYLNTARQKKIREGELWNGAHEYWSGLAAAYARCVQRYSADPHGAVAFRLKAPVALTRAIRALRCQLQWTRIRYAAPKAELWSELANLYSVAESADADKELLIYPGETTTTQREFLKTLMQSALSSEELTPQGQDFASVVVSHFAPSFVLSTTPDSGCTHWFDPTQPKAPMRTTRRTTRTPSAESTAYYFGAGPAVESLEKMIVQVEATGELPPGLAKEGMEPALVKSILEHVHRDWSGKTQARAHERQKVNSRITVVPGFKDIMRTIEFAVSDSLDFTDQPTAESWVVDDVSEGGYGAVIPSVAGDWVEVGSLVGVEGDVPRAWRVGVIRRVQRVEFNQQRVGVQLLSQNAILVRMRRENEQQAPVSVSQQIPLDFAILLSTDPAAQPEVEVLVRRGSFTSMDTVYMMAKDQLIVLRPRAIVERSTGCERVAFKVIRVES